MNACADNEDMTPYEWGYEDGFIGEPPKPLPLGEYEEGWLDGFNTALAILHEDDLDGAT